MTTLAQIMERDGLFVPEPRDLLTDRGAPTAALRQWALDGGYTGRPGGWIYDRSGETVTQGWFNFASMMIRAGRARDSVELREVAKANRVRRLRGYAAKRRSLAADATEPNMRARWDREAREYDAQADAAGGSADHEAGSRTVIRYALISSGAAAIAAYMPENYSVIWKGIEDGREVSVIAGRDVAGWTLDGYVLPRLASGLYFGREIDLSHPIMKMVPA